MRRSTITNRMLHAPAPPPAQNHKRVVESEENSQDAPRASAATCPKPREGPSITKRILRMLHAPATPPAENHEKVNDYEQDAPRASAATRRKPREGRRLRTDFQGRSTRQRHHPREGRRLRTERERSKRQRRHPPETTRWSLRPEFRGRSTCRRRHPPKTTRSSSIRSRIPRRSTRQRRHPPKTTRGSSSTNRNLRTLGAPVPPPAENHEKVVDYEQNSGDAPRASHAARRKPRDRLRTGFSGCSMRRRCHRPKPCEGRRPRKEF